ncbi:hypothetical protein AAFF_G00166280 [Aldrovandia affinis]|uniref:Uncharacterized protein n=1 Tax=Aldrovandia affinis TaxID=143900 RepID=A0AAD7W831_9TELE|nr:hypothetical protein AAFF_G00166280 [Aldrovandia affinis]
MMTVMMMFTAQWTSNLDLSPGPDTGCERQLRQRNNRLERGRRGSSSSADHLVTLALGNGASPTAWGLWRSHGECPQVLEGSGAPMPMPQIRH